MKASEERDVDAGFEWNRRLHSADGATGAGGLRAIGGRETGDVAFCCGCCEGDQGREGEDLEMSSDRSSFSMKLLSYHGGCFHFEITWITYAVVVSLGRDTEGSLYSGIDMLQIGSFCKTSSR